MCAVAWEAMFRRRLSLREHRVRRGAASALVAGFCEGSSIGVAATFWNAIDHLGIGFFHWTVGSKSFIYMRMHVLNKVKNLTFKKKFKF